LDAGWEGRPDKGPGIIGDELPAHRSRGTKRYLEAQEGTIQIERLPAYAPELNPVEYVWGL